MKILLLTSSFPVKVGDYYGNFLLSHVQTLSDKGFKVKVLCPHTYQAKTQENLSGAEVRRFRYFFPKLQKIAYGDGMLNNLKSSTLAKLELPFFLFGFIITTITLSKKVDLVHAHWAIPSGMVAVLSKIITGKKVVITLQGSDIDRFRTGWKLVLIKSIIRRADFIIAANKHLHEQAIKLGVDKEKVRTIYDGIDGLEILLKVPIRDETNQKALFVGRLSQEKNLSLLISSLPKVVKAVPKFQLEVIGDGPEKNKIIKIIKDLKLEGVVNLRGRKPSREIPLYLSKSDVVILSQKVPGGFGLVPMEAMAAGRVMILGDVKYSEELIANGEDGFLVSLNTNSVSDAIIKVFNDDELRIKVGTKAKALVKQKFSKEKIGDELSKVYKNIMSMGNK